MWDIEKSDDATLPFYMAAAVLDAQQWLLRQQSWEGLAHADNRGLSWTLSPRLAARHFGVARYPSESFGEAAQNALLILARPERRWAESKEILGTPSEATSNHPLLWFAAIPWRAHLSKNRDHLVLLCPEQPVGWKTFPAWTLTMPISLVVWRILYEDYRRYQRSSAHRQVSRMALGDGIFVPALGFDVEWGSIVEIPVRVDPLVAEMKKVAAREKPPVFAETGNA